ncbi:hypothetical protein HAX54_000453 [Datura stramonium]|uniref:K Homology domain-containing protein n=1 Tax=Datura stramonium TaxID=4076 RepID=A0ABS8T142_DATST|nr:hypothetical protein [Datura stramonium]
MENKNFSIHPVWLVPGNTLASQREFFAIKEIRGVPGEMIVEITGSASQVQSAQQLIQNATRSMQNTAAGPPSQGYNPYSQCPVYGSPSGGTGHPSAADYGSSYGY